ncbi:MAG: NADH-quinone oxidoreductase subunit NuoF [Candidatus Atribacteria bacterium]|nr:NADH-quinone oxidoreductase subunit NuoF [Candidatus Atribacteria bacterium]
MVIYPEGVFYQKVKPEDAEEIIQEHLLKGRVVKRLFYKKPKTEEMIEMFNDIDFFKLQKKIALRNCGIINPLEIEEYIAADGYLALGKALTEITPQQVIEEVKKSGLRGRGGAGFPTGLKWQFTAASPGKQKYVCCNADEGDPGAFMDRSILEGDPHSVMEAMMICGYAIGADQGYVYVRAEYPLALERLSIAIEQAKKNELLGKNILGTDFNFDIEIRMGAGAFVCGEETALMRSIEGKRGEPRPRPPYPAQKGLFECPTVLNNVETFANIPYIILNGAGDFASVGNEKSRGTKVFALAGDINNTGLIEIPIGMPLGTIIYDIGGGIPNNKKLKAVQIGGPSGGCIPADHLNVKVDYESLQELGAIMGSGGLIVMDEDTCMVDIARYFMEFIQEESCGKCTPCREGTRIMLNILERICQGKGKMEDLDTLEELSRQIKQTSLCALGQTAPNPIEATLRYFREEYVEHIRDKKCRAGVCSELVYSPCSNECPASVNVPGYLAYTKEGNFQKALEIHLKNNPFPAVCGRVCPHQCEAKCRRNDLDSAVSIRSVKRFMADSMDHYLKCFPEKQNSNGMKVAVIGSGPSGLSNAYFLTILGYEVTVFESEAKAGGMLTYAIPSYRLSKNIVEKEIQALSLYGVKIKTNTKIGKDITINELRKKGFKAFYVAVGAGDSMMPLIEGIDGNNRVMSGLDFLYKINNHEKISIGQEVVVIGGGNTAIDAARTARRMGADVAIVYRRTREEMPAEIEEIKEAENEGIKIQLLQNIKSVKSNSNNKLAVEFVNMRLGEFDKSGRRRPVEIETSSFVKEVSLLILAIGQKPSLNGLFDKELVKLNRDSTICCSSHKGETMSEDIFAGGDVVTGPSTVVEAIGQAQGAAEAIDKYLTGGQEEYPWNIMDPIEVEFDPEEEPVKYERAKNILIPVEERDSFAEVEKTWNSATACKESERCLRCEFKKEEEGS